MRNHTSKAKRIHSKHVGLYLLRNCTNVCKLIYLVRGVPQGMIGSLLDGFDKEMRPTVEEVVGFTLQHKVS